MTHKPEDLFNGYYAAKWLEFCVVCHMWLTLI